MMFHLIPDAALLPSKYRTRQGTSVIHDFPTTLRSWGRRASGGGARPCRKKSCKIIIRKVSKLLNSSRAGGPLGDGPTPPRRLNAWNGLHSFRTATSRRQRHAPLRATHTYTTTSRVIWRLGNWEIFGGRGPWMTGRQMQTHAHHAHTAGAATLGHKPSISIRASFCVLFLFQAVFRPEFLGRGIPRVALRTPPRQAGATNLATIGTYTGTQTGHSWDTGGSSGDTRRTQPRQRRERPERPPPDNGAGLFGWRVHEGLTSPTSDPIQIAGMSGATHTAWQCAFGHGGDGQNCPK